VTELGYTGYTVRAGDVRRMLHDMLSDGYVDGFPFLKRCPRAPCHETRIFHAVLCSKLDP